MLLAFLAVALLFVVCGLGIGGDNALEVSQNHLVGTLRNDIVGHHRGLAAAAGGIHHKGGNTETGSVSPQGLP